MEKAIEKLIERLENAPRQEAIGYIGETIKVLRSCLLLYCGVEAMRHRYLGDCGHEWRKDQSEECPVCALARARAALVAYRTGMRAAMVERCNMDVNINGPEASQKQ